MATVINVSNVYDNSGETPILTPSNPVTTVIEPNDTPCRLCYCRCCYRCCCCCRRYRWDCDCCTRRKM